jgi:hypothetical protein
MSTLLPTLRSMVAVMSRCGRVSLRVSHPITYPTSEAKGGTSWMVKDLMGNVLD